MLNKLILTITLIFLTACGAENQVDDQITDQDAKIWGLFYASDQPASEIITDFAPTAPKPSSGYVSSFFVKKEMGEYYAVTIMPDFGISIVCSFVRSGDRLNGNGLSLQFKNIDGKTHMLAIRTGSDSSCPNIEFNKVFVD